MCAYFRIKYACGCLSKLYIQRCCQCLSSGAKSCEHIEYIKAEPRSSFSPCYDCIYREWVEEQAGNLKAKMLEEKIPTAQDNIRLVLERMEVKKQKVEVKRIKATEDVEFHEDPQLGEDRATSPNPGDFWNKGQVRSSVGVDSGLVKRQMARVGSFGTVGPLSAPPAPSSGFGASKMGLFGREVEGHLTYNEGEDNGSSVVGSGPFKILVRNPANDKEGYSNEGKNDGDTNLLTNKEVVKGEVKKEAEGARKPATNGGSQKSAQGGGEELISNGVATNNSPDDQLNETTENEAKTPVKNRTNDHGNGNDYGPVTPSPKRDPNTNPKSGDEGYGKRCTKGLRSPEAHRALDLSSWRKH